MAAPVGSTPLDRRLPPHRGVWGLGHEVLRGVTPHVNFFFVLLLRSNSGVRVPAQHPQWAMVTQCGVCLSTVSVDILPDSPLAFRPHHADDPRQNDAVWVDFAGPREGADGRCSTQGSEEPVEATQTRGAHPLEPGRGKGAGHPIKAPQAGGALA